MKQPLNFIAILFTILTISLCCWFITKQINLLDIAANKSDTWVLFEKTKIDEQTNLSAIQRERLKNEIDLNRAIQKDRSVQATKTFEFLLYVIFLQICLLTLLIFNRLKYQRSSKSLTNENTNLQN